VRIPAYHVDAFTDRLFAGNPAVVCPLDAWLPGGTMQRIAFENNVSETAFFVREEGRFHLRWFTPAIEVNLCGHATLASAHVILNHRLADQDEVRFDTRSGELVVRRAGEGLVMDFPTLPPLEGPVPEAALAALPAPEEVYGIRKAHGAAYLLAVYRRERDVRDMTPDLRALRAAGANAIVTAPGEDVDFVSRFFAPASGVDEDPVTGSAHCTLAPYWGARLGKRVLRARQVSRRGGDLLCELAGDRVLLTGRCVTFLEGHITL
jgi:PhzF family phenazine biosynthesis protein